MCYVVFPIPKSLERSVKHKNTQEGHEAQKKQKSM